MKNLRYLFGFVLLLVAGVSLAAGVDPYHFNYTQSLMCTDPHTGITSTCDMSMHMLGSVFGTVGSTDSVASLPGNGMIAMGYMFRIFNEGVCGIIGLLTSYGVFNFAIRSAQDGMQGESRKGLTSLLRIVLAVSLVLPQATGYSLMQRLVMKTVVYGAGLADGIYRGVLTGMADGAIVLFHRDNAKAAGGASSISQGDAAISQDDINAVLSDPSKSSGSSSLSQGLVIKKIFHAEVCRAVSNKYSRQLSGFTSYGDADASNFSSYLSSCKQGDSKHAQDIKSCLMKKSSVFAAACSDNTNAPSLCKKRLTNKTGIALTSWFNKQYLPAFGLSDPTKSLPRSYQLTDNLGYATDIPGNGNNLAESSSCAPGSICFAGFNSSAGNKANNYANNNSNCGVLTVKSGDPKQSKYMSGPVHVLIDSLQSSVDNLVSKSFPDQNSNAMLYQKILATPNPSQNALLGTNCIAYHAGSKNIPAVCQPYVNDGALSGTAATAAYTSINYVQLLQPIMRVISSANVSKTATALKHFAVDAKHAGWVAAGRYYFDIIRLNNYLQETSTNLFSTANLKQFKAKPSLSISGTNGLVDPITRKYDDYFSNGMLKTKIKNKLAIMQGKGGYQGNKADAQGINPHDQSGVSGGGRDADGDIGRAVHRAWDNHGSDFANADNYTKPFADGIDAAGNEYNNAKADPELAAVQEWNLLKGVFGNNSDGLSSMMQKSMKNLYATTGPGLLLLLPMTKAMGNIAGFFSNQQGTENPIVFIHQLGMKILNEVLNGMIVTNGVIMVMSLGANICSAESPLGAAVNNSIGWVSGFVKTLTGPLIMAGAVCAYYVPMYPFLVFTFGVISWLVSVIDAMIAMPLVCLGLAHPDGHEFMGKAEGATMLLMGVFIRPAVMIFAFFSAMAVSYVALRLLNMGFMGVLVSTLGTGMQMIHASGTSVNAATGAALHMTAMGTGGNLSTAIQAAIQGDASTHGFFGGNVIAVIAMPAIFIIYTMMVYSVVTQSFGMMSELVTGVLKWVGGPQMGDNSVQMAQQIQGAVGSGASSAAGAAGGSSDGSKQAPATKQKKPKDDTKLKSGGGAGSK